MMIIIGMICVCYGMEHLYNLAYVILKNGKYYTDYLKNTNTTNTTKNNKVLLQHKRYERYERLIIRIVKQEKIKRINILYREMFEWVRVFLMTICSKVLRYKVSNLYVNYREMLYMQSYDRTITTQWTSPKIYNFITCKSVDTFTKNY